MAKVTNKIKKFVYRKIYGDGAQKILKSIEKQQGELSPAIKKQCDEYASDVFKNRKHAKFLYVYCAIQGEFKEGWIPESYYFQTVLPLLKKDYGRLGELNGLQSSLFGKNSFPDLAYIINGFFYKPNLERIDYSELCSEILNDHEYVVIKSDNSARGKGIKIVEVKNLNSILINKVGNGVIQYFIHQNSFFDRFKSSAVATIRLITTINPQNEFCIAGSFLRLGRSSDLHIKSESTIKVPIDLKEGTLSKKGYLPDWTSVEAHPDSGVNFEGLTVPCLSDCFELVKILHKQVPYVNCIGWDLTIDNNNNVIPIEWNGYNNGIKFIEAINGPCFKHMGWESLVSQTGLTPKQLIS